MTISDKEAAHWGMTTQWRRSAPLPATHSIEETVYSDRLLHWDWDKHNKICREVFGNEGQWWNERAPEKIEEFLSKYQERELSLTAVFQGTNQGNGFPYWLFQYKTKADEPNEPVGPVV